MICSDVARTGLGLSAAVYQRVMNDYLIHRNIITEPLSLSTATIIMKRNNMVFVQRKSGQTACRSEAEMAVLRERAAKRLTWVVGKFRFDFSFFTLLMG